MSQIWKTSYLESTRWQATGNLKRALTEKERSRQKRGKKKAG
jgi:hypothetical protein